MEQLLTAMRAVAEPTRLRIMNLCAHSELTVTDLVGLLGQSQPRLSRHLKLLVEGGVLERHREGTWARYRLASPKDGSPGAFAASVLDLLPTQDPVLSQDLDRLEALRAKRRREAADYFKRNAEHWDRIRALHVDEAALAERLRATTADWPLENVLDIGTGTGKLLELFGPRAGRAVGVDLSNEMLRLARTVVERDGLGNCQVRLADMYRLPCADGEFDTALLHMVLHYAEDPAAALREAGRATRAGGHILIADFETHTLAELRAEHAHLWPGFSHDQISTWLSDAGYEDVRLDRLDGAALTVCVWTARKAALDTEAAA